MKTEFQNTVISKLRRLREINGFNQSMIAADLGISPGQLGNIESYKHSHKYTLRQIVKLCNKFDVKIEDIFLEKKEITDVQNITRSIIDAIIKYQESNKL